VNEPRFTTGDDWIFKNVLYELSYVMKNIAFQYELSYVMKNIAFHNFPRLSRLFQRYIIYFILFLL
jgi:purine-cytosine permease-like protein